LIYRNTLYQNLIIGATAKYSGNLGRAATSGSRDVRAGFRRVLERIGDPQISPTRRSFKRDRLSGSCPHGDG